jgi:HEAT repeat protein
LDQRIASNPVGDLKKEELLEVGARCLPGFFKRGRPDFERVSVPSEFEESEPRTDEDPERSADTEKAIGLMASESPAKRVRGLGLLAKIGDPDLFDWCAMSLGDESDKVQVAALEAMQACDEIDEELVRSYVEAEDRRLRGAAIATLARHASEGAEGWLRLGLTDPEPHVRVAAARQLGGLDPSAHGEVFDLALMNSHAEVVRIAERLAKG